MIFDRLIHTASLLNCFFVWLIWLTITVVQGDKKIAANFCLLMAGAVGLSLLTESTAILFVFVPLLFKLVYFHDENIPSWSTWLLIYVFGIGIGILPYVYLYSTDASFQVSNIFVPKVHGLVNVDTISLFLGIPRTAFYSAGDVINYFEVYLTWPILLLSSIWFVINLRRHNRALFVLLAFFCFAIDCFDGNSRSGIFPVLFVLSYADSDWRGNGIC